MDSGDKTVIPRYSELIWIFISLMRIVFCYQASSVFGEHLVNILKIIYFTQNQSLDSPLRGC
jgi:hypothetical protein